MKTQLLKGPVVGHPVGRLLVGAAFALFAMLLLLPAGTKAGALAMIEVNVTAPAHGSTVGTPTASVHFDVNTNVGTKEKCSVDGVVVADPCTSPWTTPAMTDGPHYLSVVSEQEGGNLVGHGIIAILVDTGSPAPPPPPPPVRPTITKLPKTIKPGRAVPIELTCPEGCVLNFQLKAGRKKLAVKAKRVRPGTTLVKLKLPKKAVKQIKRALKKNKRTKVTLRVTPQHLPGTAGSVRIR